MSAGGPSGYHDPAGVAANSTEFPIAYVAWSGFRVTLPLPATLVVSV